MFSPAPPTNITPEEAGGWWVLQCLAVWCSLVLVEWMVSMAVAKGSLCHQILGFSKRLAMVNLLFAGGLHVVCLVFVHDATDWQPLCGPILMTPAWGTEWPLLMDWQARFGWDATEWQPVCGPITHISTDNMLLFFFGWLPLLCLGLWQLFCLGWMVAVAIEEFFRRVRGFFTKGPLPSSSKSQALQTFASFLEIKYPPPTAPIDQRVVFSTTTNISDETGEANQD